MWHSGCNAESICSRSQLSNNPVSISIQYFPIRLIGFFKYLSDFFLHLGRDSHRLWNKFDHITRLPQEILDTRYVGKIIFAEFSGDREITRFLDQLTRTDDALSGRDHFCHICSLCWWSDDKPPTRPTRISIILPGIPNTFISRPVT